MKDNGLSVALVALVMGGAVALAVMNDVTGPACEAAKIQVHASEKFDFGCLEFWLNRYQSLLGNLITAAITGAALFWAAGQLVAANRQAATSAAAALRVRVGELEDELAHIDRLDDMAGTASAVITEMSYNRDVEVLRADRTQIAACWERFREQRSTLQASSRANRTSSDNELRLALLSRLDDIGVLIAQAFHATRGRSDYNSITDQELAFFSKVHSSAKSRFPHFFPASAALREQLEREAIATWDQIRRFENSAITGQAAHR